MTLLVVGGGPLADAARVALRAVLPSHRIVVASDADDTMVIAGSVLVVGIADAARDAPLHRLNRATFARHIPYLPVRIAADAIRLGPLVAPGETACLLCTALREAANSDAIPEEAPPSVTAIDDGTRAAVAAQVVHGALAVIHREATVARGRLGLFDTATHTWSWHPVLRHPRCPVCGDAPWQPTPPGDDPFAPFVSDETGIVQAVIPVPTPHGEPSPPHVAMAFLANTAYRDDWDAAPPGDRTTTGKGWTPEAARRAALGEAVERYCATLSAPPGRFRIAPRADLDAPSLGPHAFGLYDAAQYADPAFPYRPATDATLLHWVEGFSLARQCPILVPAALVCLLPLDPLCQQTSSGLAEGVTYKAAALRALCEVIERDAFLRAWQAMRPAPRLDLAAIGGETARIVAHYAARGIALTAHDLTTQTGVPAVLARIHDPSGTPPHDLIGLGCDPDPARAVERALLEVVQGRTARWEAIAATRRAPEIVRTHSDHALYYALADHGDAFAFLGTRPGPLPTFIGQPGDDASASLAAVATVLARAGHEAVIVDITTPDVRAAGMHVVRALVPGLIPIHFGAGNERRGALRRADVSLLNPAPHPLA